MSDRFWRGRIRLVASPDLDPGGFDFIGGVHDFSALVASIRHRATSIIEVVRIHISGRAYLLFLAFVWLALVYIVVAFTDITATMFVGALDLASGKPYTSIADAQSDPGATMLVQSGGVATSSLIYLVLPIIMGLLVKSGKLSMTVATWGVLAISCSCDHCRSIHSAQRRPTHSAALPQLVEC